MERAIKTALRHGWAVEAAGCGVTLLRRGVYRIVYDHVDGQLRRGLVAHLLG